MKRSRLLFGERPGDSGTALVLFLGIMVALCILSIGLVTVLANAQHFTSRDKARTTAFNVAEAAIDVTMQAISKTWPEQTSPWIAGSFATKAPAFAGTFGVSYAATQGNAVWVTVLDDGVTGPATDGWDANDNGYLWIDAQARVNGVSSRIRTLVQAKFYEMDVPRGVVVCAGGNLLSNAAGGNTSSGKNKIGAGDVSIGGPQPVSIAIWGTGFGGTGIENPEVAWPYVDQDPPTKPKPQELVTPDLITDLTQIASQTGKLFDLQKGQIPSGDDFRGLCVVKGLSTDTVQIGQTGKTDSFNTSTSPGILLVLGGAKLKFAGNTEYYGVVYCESDIGVGVGNPIIYGMVVTSGSFDMGGVAQVVYREDCLINLNHQFQTSTKIVPNYWRELQPVAH